MDTQELIIKTKKRIWRKWSLAVKIFPIVLLISILKFLSHNYGFEVMELNALFSSLIAGTIFLIGFLISGVLTDYKYCFTGFTGYSFWMGVPATEEAEI